MMKYILSFCFAAVCCFFMTGCSPSESDICKNAKALITERLADMNPTNPVSCVSVEITKRVSERSWCANAKLDNGKIMELSMKLHDDDTLEIDFSAWLEKEMEHEFNREMRKIDREFNQEIKDIDHEFNKEMKKLDQNDL